MDESKKLYHKNSRELSYFLLQSKNPMMLLRWCRHFFCRLVPDECFLSKEPINELELLFPDFQARIIAVFSKYKELVMHDIPAFYETYRSNVRQYQLFFAGKSQVKSYGMHYYGIACDCINFKNHIPKWNLNYDILLELASKVGLYNLRPYEECHLQFIPVDKQNDWRSFARSATLCMQDLINVRMDGVIGAKTQGGILFNLERFHVYFNELEERIKNHDTNNP